MIPVFSVVGKSSNTGKTTVMCQLIKELKKKGYRAATLSDIDLVITIRKASHHMTAWFFILFFEKMLEKWLKIAKDGQTSYNKGIRP